MRSAGSIMLSVIIPTCDRPASLRRCLDGLARLTTPDGAMEVIVVDDGSREPVAGLVADFAGRLALRQVAQQNAGPAAARNAGARLAAGDWLAFLDDDCVVAADWWSRLDARRAANGNAMIGGGTHNDMPDDRYAACHQLLLDYLYRELNPHHDRAAFCASNNLAVRACHFRELGGFDSGFRFAAGEDRDLCDRWRASGRVIVHAPEILVYHTHRMSLGSFWRQHYRYGRGASRYHARRSARVRSAEISTASRPAFHLGLLAFPVRQVALAKLPTSVGLLLLTQVATACGYAVERLRAAPHDGH